MLPIYKWTGGKRREIKNFSEFFPDFVKNNEKYTFIEPFFGGGAVFWNLENINGKNIINDIDKELINFLNIVKTNTNKLNKLLKNLSKNIKEITDKERSKEIDIKEAKKLRGEYYYELRNQDRKDGLVKLSEFERAYRFLVVNQMSFNGMRRFNSKGEFNIPYGNYKTFNVQVSKEQENLLQNTEIYNKSYEDVILENDKENTFIFLDPPYTREFKEYSFDNSFGNEEQKKLSEIFKKVKKAKIMLVINEDNYLKELYKGYIKEFYTLKYNTNIKNRFDNSVKHMIITNY